MPADGRDDDFPVIRYAGDGCRVAGVEPDLFSHDVDAKLPFSILVHGSPPKLDYDNLEVADRLWVMPKRFTNLDGPPTLLLCHLVRFVRVGRNVALAATEELVCDQICGVLMLALAEPGGRA